MHVLFIMVVIAITAVIAMLSVLPVIVIMILLATMALMTIIAVVNMVVMAAMAITGVMVHFSFHGRNGINDFNYWKTVYELITRKHIKPFSTYEYLLRATQSERSESRRELIIGS